LIHLFPMARSVLLRRTSRTPAAESFEKHDIEFTVVYIVKPPQPGFQYVVHSARGATSRTGCGKTALRFRGIWASTGAEFLAEFSCRRTRQRQNPVAEYDEVRMPCPDAAQPRV
jgi:hypothetical protein